MSYLEEFQTQIDQHNYAKLLQLWEEYSSDDNCEPKELLGILKALYISDIADKFGQYAETALPLWEKINDKKLSHEILKWILDLQTTNSQQLATITLTFLQENYGKQKHFNEKIRLIGLRNRKSFTKAISNYELLTHLDKGRFVFHNAGWGTGEIVDISLVREELILEFEYVIGKKAMTFANAFKNLIPLDEKHFLARRFGDPDALELYTKKTPLEVIHMVLKDLGPKTGSELKEELCELVIPKDDWSKWWQNARAKIKKDTLIETPASIKEPFKLREQAVSHVDRFKKVLEGKKNPDNVLLTIYNFTRDFPEILKSEEEKKLIRERLEALLSQLETQKTHKLQVLLFLDQLSSKGEKDPLKQFIQESQEIGALVNYMSIIAFKKKALIAIREFREDWIDIFFEALFTINMTPLKDYAFKELLEGTNEDLLKQKLEELLENPITSPESFIWAFQKVVGKGKFLLKDKKWQCRFFESFFILTHQLEDDPAKRDLIKKLYTILSANRYAVVRQVLQDTSLEYVKEFLLLVSKCRSLSDRDLKIMQSLAEVVHPSLAKDGKRGKDDVIWTSNEGFEKIQNRIKQIGTVEVVENAKEIETARALGDLRENAEYKSALERRARLQGELKTLSRDLNKARILTEDDVLTEEISVGTIVTFKDSASKEHSSYTILGPWDADVDQNIFSYQSKVGTNMLGKKLGDSVDIQGKTLVIESIHSYFSS